LLCLHILSLAVFSGADGSGAAIHPQLPELHDSGFAVWALYTPPTNRMEWPELVVKTAALMQQACSEAGGPVLLLAESYGTCLALRLALQHPELIHRMVLINSATCFERALGGLASALTATGLLQLFPQPLFSVAQVRTCAVLQTALCNTLQPHKCSLKPCCAVTACHRCVERFWHAGSGSAFAREPF
jgi:pimeloyl-ACP methyl ester carboxylesterase